MRAQHHWKRVPALSPPYSRWKKKNPKTQNKKLQYGELAKIMKFIYLKYNPTLILKLKNKTKQDKTLPLSLKPYLLSLKSELIKHFGDTPQITAYFSYL